MSWPMVKLDDIFDIARGGSPRPIKDYITTNSDGVNWVSIKDASNSEKYITKTKLKIKRDGISKSREVKPGDFLLTNSMSFGRPYIMKTSGCIHDGWLVLSGDSKKVDSGYFYYLLGSEMMYREFSGLAAGAVVKNLNIDLVKSVKIPLPPLEEQKCIAAILDKADAIRRKRQQAIDLTDQLLHSVFLEMFGDPVTNPKNLPTLLLGDVSTRVTDGTHQSPDWADSGIPFLFVSNIVNHEILFDVNKYITERNWIELTRRCPIEEGDVLYTTVGSYGNAALVKKNTRFCFQRHIAHIKPNKELIHPVFLWAMMNSSGVKRQANKQARGIAQQTLNLKELKEFVIFLPSMETQLTFVKLANKIKSKIEKLHEHSYLSESFFSSLTQRAFRGELSQQSGAA